MFKKVSKPLRRLGPLAVAVVVATLGAGPSIAEAKDARVKSFSFSASQAIPGHAVNVISSTGERWDRIAGSDISLKIDFTLKMSGRKARIARSGLFLGVCHKKLCGGNILIRTYPHRPTNPTRLPTSKIPVSTSGIAIAPYGDQIIRACNQYLSNGPSTAHQFTHPITVTLSIDTQRGRPGFVEAGSTFVGGDVSRQSTFRVKVKCIPYASLIHGANPVEVKLDAIARDGNSCPRNTTIKTRITYHYDRNVKFNILRNGKVIKIVELRPRKVAVSHGPDLWVVNRQDVVKAKAGQNRFRIKVKGGGESQIKTVNIECAPFQPLFANLQYNVAGSESCPKKVWETTTFTANGPGSLVYQLVRENGSVALEKSVNSILKNGQYKLVKQRVLTIHNSIDRKYRVQVKGSTGINSSWARLKVDCPPPADKVVPKPPSRIKTAPAPKTQAPKKRRIKTAVPPKRVKPTVTRLICKKGKVRAGKCFCGAKRKRVRIGAHKYKCVAKGKTRVNKPKSQRLNPNKARRKPAARRCGPKKAFVRGRCIRRAG